MLELIHIRNLLNHFDQVIPLAFGVNAFYDNCKNVYAKMLPKKIGCCG
jgi:hypothetical protein